MPLLADFLQSILQNQIDTVQVDLGMEHLSHLKVHIGHDLGRHLHQLDLYPQFHQVFHHFQADEAPTDNGRPLHLMPGNIGLDLVHVRNVAQAKDILGLLQAWDSWQDGLGPC